MVDVINRLASKSLHLPNISVLEMLLGIINGSSKAKELKLLYHV